MDKIYKFEFELTKEQVDEMKLALKERQDSHYKNQILIRETEERKKILNKFTVMEAILDQFNTQLLDNKLL